MPKSIFSSAKKAMVTQFKATNDIAIKKLITRKQLEYGMKKTI